MRSLIRRLYYRLRWGVIPERDATGRIVSWVNPKVMAEMRRRMKEGSARG